MRDRRKDMDDERVKERGSVRFKDEEGESSCSTVILNAGGLYECVDVTELRYWAPS